METWLNMRRSVKFLLSCQTLACALSITFDHSHCAFAYTSKSPEVQRLVKAGLDFLASSTDRRLGGKCLIALAFVKAEAPSNHPKIIEAVAECKAVVANGVTLKKKGTVGDLQHRHRHNLSHRTRCGLVST